MMIPEEIIATIRETARIEDVIADYVPLKGKGAALTGDCPQCGGKGKLSVSKAKQIWKCFVCDIGGSDAVSFLTGCQHMAYPDALRLLADKYSITIPENGEKVKPGKVLRTSFRDAQLLASRITQDAQTWWLDGSGRKVESDRYQSASIDQMWNVVAGDDMILHYVDLDGMPMTYVDKKGRTRPLIRVRWQNPALHLDKDGKEVKYQTPPGGGSPLWLPQWLIKAYATHKPIDTLFITEGEKKADCMCLHDLPAVAITGIHNFANTGSMPRQLEMIIRQCKVQRVCFLLDSDFQELAAKPGDDITKRPNLFYRSVLKFQKYFQAFQLEGLELKIFFAAGNDIAYKGADDLIVRGLKKDRTLHDDFQDAFLDREGKGQYITAWDITVMSEYKIQEIWHLQNPQAFRDHHKEKLLQLKIFRQNGLQYKVVEDKIELDQKLLPHERYWREEQIETRSGVKSKVQYDVLTVNDFLRNRGYGLYQSDEKAPVRYVHMSDKVVAEVKALDIKRYVMDFTREIGEEEVLRMLMNGSRNYFATDKLEHMYMFQPSFLQPERDMYYFIFEDQYWKITKDAITTHKLAELPGVIWKDRIIKFSPKLHKDHIVKVDRDDEDWTLDLSKDALDSDIVKFFLCTSNFSWRMQFEERATPDGVVYIPRDYKPTPVQLAYNITHMVCKMLATGYILHDFKNKSQMKAIIAVDNNETEVGRSEGGTGKSIWSTMFEWIMPTEVLDGKKPRLQDDPHMYENVDERTQLIVFDDCRVNLDFEFFLSQITRGVEVNPKGLKRFKIEAPKFIFSTNHAVNGEGNSFERRQYYIAFSDYFNRNRTPADEMGRVMFHEWDWVQWNHFYNFMACCVQTYIRYPDLNTYQIPSKDVRRRQLRQRMGEEFLEFMESWWSDKINHAVRKAWALEEYFRFAPNERKYVKSTVFKKKILAYCEYAGYTYNPGLDYNDRLRNNGYEYVLIADGQYKRDDMQYLGGY